MIPKSLKIKTIIFVPILLIGFFYSFNSDFIIKLNNKHNSLTSKNIIESIKIEKDSSKILILPMYNINEISGFLEVENDTTEIKQIKNKYNVVVGSFTVLENAKHSMEIMKENGYKPELIKFDKIYRVSIGSFDNKEVAIKLIEEIRNNGFKCWIIE